MTGASGIGLQMTKLFLKYGATVVVWDVNKSGLEDMEESLSNPALHTFVIDITQNDSVYSTAKEVQEQIGDVDILINNAGVVAGTELLETSDEKIKLTMDVNVMAHFWTLKAFLPAMISKNSGHIVTISSILGTFGGNRLTEYSTSKFACFGLNECVRLELLNKQKTGVHTTVVCPYLIDTGMFDGLTIPPFVKLVVPPLKPYDVAYRVLEAIKRKEPQVFIPGWYWATYLLRFIAPVNVIDAISKRSGFLDAMNTFIGRHPVQEPST